jgi:putative transposase
LVEPNDKNLTVEQQCSLLGLNRSTYYYEPKTICDDTDIMLMNLIDRLHTAHPYYGYRRIKSHLPDMLGADYQHILPINHKKIRRLMQVMGLETLYPKPNLSKRNTAHKVFPYLLRHVPITHQRQVYSTDISYLPMAKGFMYLTAVIDWYSRFVLAWRLSNTLSVQFCLDVVQDAFDKYGKPEIFNTDQGSQYTSNEFVNLILDNGIKLSMDGKGRAIDNIYCERHWRSYKQEYLYIHAPENGNQLFKGTSQYYDFYNYQRKHQSLNERTPSQLFLLP